MSEILHPTLMARLSDLLADQTGLHFPRERWRDLERGLRSASKEFGFEDGEECLRWLTTSRLDKNQIEILAGHLTIGETYFFRDKKSFEVLEKHLLPPLLQERRGNGDKRLRIWSAACCTGEEAYSIAITLSRMLPDYKDWRITVLATDLNPRFLELAGKGVFREWAFRATPPEVKERYFRVTPEGHFALLPEIRNMVKFEYLNLAEDVYPALLNDTNAMDVIFCRNVLIYFDNESAHGVIQQLYRCLVSGGWLLTSPSETLHHHFSEFETLHYPGAIVYRKSAADATPGTRHSFDYFAPEGTAPVVVPTYTPAVVPPERPPEPAGLNASPPPWVALDRARELFDMGRYDEAIVLLEGAAGEAPGVGEPAALLARAYANGGHLDKALGAIDKSIAADKMNSAFHYLRATILQEQADFEAAVAALKRALYLDHDFVMAHYALGNLAVARQKPDEAARHFRITLSLLDRLEPEAVLPESDGITASRLAEIVDAIPGDEI